MQTELILIMGQCGCGKTTTVNRLLDVEWNTCSFTTGTLLPFIKTYQFVGGMTNEKTFEPYLATRNPKVELCEGECLFKMKQRLDEEICWDITSENETDAIMADNADSVCFVDLMGIGDTLLTNEYYYEIYRAFAREATQIVWITDATSRRYTEDERCLSEIKRDFVNIKKFVIGVNKSDSICLDRGERFTEGVPTDKQMDALRDRKELVFSTFKDVLMPYELNMDDIVMFSAKTGWNFSALERKFFIKKGNLK